MKFTSSALVVSIFLLCVETQDIPKDDTNVDPASRQLYDYRATHKPTLLTTSAGAPVEVKDTSSINKEILTNQFVFELIKNLAHERIPNREVNAKGTGAFGYFEVTNDITMFTKARVFEKVGKRTPIVVRLGTSQAETGGTDFEPLGLRGFSLKFYTEEGNLDFLNIQIPVFFFRDPVLFTLTARALRRNPKTFLKDFTAVFDLITNDPHGLHSLLWMASEFGLPRGFRRMNGFPIHVYEIYNKNGERFYAKFKFLTELGYDSFSLEECAKLNNVDPDFYIRDVHNSIASGNYPSWRLEMDVMSESGIKSVDFDPFDVTRLWKNGTYQTFTIGRVVLNRNIDNHFAQVECATYNPANLVPGIMGPPDHLFKGRIIAYNTAHINRLGVNRNNIEVNHPRSSVNTYLRDGKPPVLDNMRDAPSYYPNSFNGPLPNLDNARPLQPLQIVENNTVDYQPAREFYRYQTRTLAQKTRLIDNLIDHIIRVPHPTQDRFIDLLFRVDEDFGNRFRQALTIAKETRREPNVVEDIPKRTEF